MASAPTRSLHFLVLLLIAASALSMGAQCGGVTFEGDDPGECDDAADNDIDGLFDCDDPDCDGSPVCAGEGDMWGDDDTFGDDDDLVDQDILLVPDADALGLPPLRTYGVSLVDFDEDGRPDVTIAAKEGVYLLRNEGDWNFSDVTESMGLRAPELASRVDQAHAVVWLDVDDDGDLDLFIVRRRRMQDIGPGIDSSGWTPSLFLRTGPGELIDVTAESGLLVNGFWEGAAFGDLDGDGDLDLIVLGGINTSTFGGDPGYMGSPGKLWRNQGDGTFVEMSQESGCTGPDDSESWQVLAVDFEGDGDMDLFEANDRRASTLCLNDGNGVFHDLSGEINLSFGSPMGLAVGDLNGDACIEVYGTNFGEPDTALNFDTSGGFTEVYAGLLGFNPDLSREVSGYGVSMNDTDLDGDQDLLWVAAYDIDYFSNSLIGGIVAYARNSGQGQSGRLRYQNPGNAPMLEGVHNAYGMAHGDIDGDGDLDFLVGVDYDAPIPSDFQPPLDGDSIPLPDDASRSFLFRNETVQTGRNYLSITLRQPAPNLRAVGATVVVRAGSKRSARALMAGSSYNSTNAYPLHFGLGARERPDWVFVRWPDGYEQLFTDIPGGRVTIERSDNICVPSGTCAGIAPECPL